MPPLHDKFLEVFLDFKSTSAPINEGTSRLFERGARIFFVCSHAKKIIVFSFSSSLYLKDKFIVKLQDSVDLDPNVFVTLGLFKPTYTIIRVFYA